MIEKMFHEFWNAVVYYKRLNDSLVYFGELEVLLERGREEPRSENTVNEAQRFVLCLCLVEGD